MTKKSIWLSDTQLSIMRALWAEGEADTQTVCDALGRTGKKPAYTTAATLLKRLENRKLVASRQRGRKLVFRPLVSEAAVQSSMVSDMIGSLFKGDSRALLSHLIKEDELNEDDLEKITEMIKKGQ